MIFFNLPINSNVPLVAPGDSCCNCGSTLDVREMPTDLRRMPLFGLAGAEIKVTLPFPYCEACSDTSKRKRPNALGIVAVAALLALVLGMGWLFFGPQVSEEVALYRVVPVITVLSLAVVLAFFALRRPSATQTSFYQPVRLKSTGHKWPADITGLELAFTNPQYSAKFAAANQAAIAAKKLKVSRA